MCWKADPGFVQLRDAELENLNSPLRQYIPKGCNIEVELTTE